MSAALRLSSDAIPVIETERLRLRGWRESDLDAFAPFWADEAQARFVGGVKTRDEVWRMLAMHIGHWTFRGYGMFAIEERAGGAFAGWCGPWNPEGWPEPEIGWGLLSGYFGRGYATEAARAARGYAYCQLGWTTAMSMIDARNAPSLRVAERLGARFETNFILRGTEVGIYRHPGPQDRESQPH